MIVKIQQSLVSSDGARRCLIYNKNKDVFYETDNEEEVKPLLELLGDRPKAYFQAEVVDTKIQVTAEVKPQSW